MTHENQTELMSDQELDALLMHATKPKLPLGAKGRLLAEISKSEVNVSPPATVQQGSRLGWLAGIPLAASLAFGLFIGSTGVESSILPSFAQELLADTALDDTNSGIDDIEDLTEESLS